MTFDCADPHAQAAFWATVLGSAVEDHSELVDQLVAEGRMPADHRIMVDGRSAFRDVAACTDPTGIEPRLFFQRVPEGKIAKNRVHLDVHVDDDRKEAEVQRLARLGAQLIDTHSDRGPLTYVLRDPEGNEFCLH
ncbi:VOC family protein [Actinoplanes sp. NPDC051475]|uniref:VOC family protein n=1 Tax=Actinoplanes sp. NPDC051475 TaxID=3157225 RepID=UPI00344B7FEC